MSEPDGSRTGGCLCGGVSFTVHGELQPVLQCHCENCRRLSGNFVAASRTATDALEIEAGSAALRWHDLGYARYGFCGNCGATLFYIAAATSDVTSVMVGTLDDATGLELAGVWFADEAQPHNTLPEGVPHHGGNG